MHPVIASFGPLTIYSYGFMLALAFSAGILLTIFLAQKKGIVADLVLDLALLVLVSSIVGARLFYVIGFWDVYRPNWIKIFYVQEGGLVFFGGLFFALLTVRAFAFFKKIPLLKLLDVIAPGTVLGYAIGRIGCFLNGCCYGVSTQSFLGVKFPQLYELHYPTQLFSSLINLLIFCFLLFLWPRVKKDGLIFYAAFFIHLIYRFLIEFLRDYPMRFFGIFTYSQILSMAFLVFGLIMFYRNFYKRA